MLRGPVLFPHDGSVLASSVIDSVGLALSAATPATVLHVDQGVPLEGRAIEEAIERLEGYGVEVTRETLPVGDPASAIVDYARVHDMTLIAMSTQGHGAGPDDFRGIVAERVLSSSTVPVLLVPPHARVEPHFTNILVPLALETESIEVLDTLIPLAQSFKSNLTLLYVDPDNPLDTEKRREERRARHKARAEKEFAQVRERIADAGLDVHLRVEHGRPHEVILELANPDDYDLLAMTTHARRGVSRWFFGSVAKKVLRDCSLPVYLQRMGMPGAE